MDSITEDDILINQKYLLKQNIKHKCSSGEIYECTNPFSTSLQLIGKQNTSVVGNRFENEVSILSAIGGEYAARLKWSQKGNGINYIVVEELGDSLQTIFERGKFKFSLTTIANIGISLLSILQKLHKLGYAHMKLDPRKVLIGKGDKAKKLYLCGLKNAVQFNKGQSTVNYSACKEDLEALGSMLLQFVTGESGTNQTNYKIQGDGSDRSMLMQRLCSDIPKEIIQYMKDVQAMNPNSPPQYDFLHSLLTTILFSYKGKQNSQGLQFDWLKKETNLEGVSLDDSSKKKPQQFLSKFGQTEGNIFSREHQSPESILVITESRKLSIVYEATGEEETQFISRQPKRQLSLKKASPVQKVEIFRYATDTSLLINLPTSPSFSPRQLREYDTGETPSEKYIKFLNLKNSTNHYKPAKKG